MTDGVTQGERLLAGRYQMGDLIGRGGMADVRVGTDVRLGRRVAIKLLKPALANDPAFRTRFRREAQDAAKMAHPTIVRIFDAGEETALDASGRETQVPFIVMEYVDGRLLKDIIAEGPMDPAEAMRIAEQILTALEYSHRAGLIHRDIKPGNIMITPTGQVKVMDFGIARAISESSATIAETSAIVGTAQYFSPEQARGEAVDARTDLYSTGIVLFELLTGQAPFRGDNPVAVAYQHVNQMAIPPSTLNHRVSPALDAVVLRALSKDRFTRYQSAAEFREELETVSRGGTPARKLSTVTKDFNATLFGVDPASTAGSEATFRQLAVDEDAPIRRTQSRPPVAWIWAGIASMAVVVIAVLFWTLNLQPAPIVNDLSVVVPNVTGQTWDQGSALLTSKKLVPQQYTEVSQTIASGIILRTVPSAGLTVGFQQIVKVYVSSGKPQISVPQLAGLTLDKAITALTDLGLAEGKVTKENSPNIAKGIVTGSTPAGGEPAIAGDMIDLIISTGLVNVPQVVGLSASDAGNKLSALQLKVTAIADSSCTGGKVSSQSLSPGAHPQRSAISITVCTG